ncbi:gliding motility-associated C-terminal domain-containing protein [Mucilaginibacter sp. UYCu711]|uniref:T9SS type B sorting domain-containing protein n=1 Tax=Mucilaginibacter sp. UYCu711 TaxID=3156339 RepID=UPI003D1AF3DE
MPASFKNMLRLIACLLVLPLTAICQVAPAWVADMGGPNGNAISTIIKVDAQNNMYVTGIFSGTVDFDPSSAGTKNLTATSTGYDGFIAKYNASGGLVWASSFGGPGTDQPNGLDVDINGNITLTGQFDSQLMDADPGAGVFNLTAAGRDAFIIRLDNNGDFLWAKSIGGTGIENGGKVVSDASGNLVVAAQFQSTINVGGTNIAPKGTKDGLLVKYDAAGNVIWKFSLGDAGGDNSIIGAVIDKNNNITIAGYINGTVDFNPLGSVNNVAGNNSMFIAQYSSSGTFLWVNVILGTAQGADYNINMALDAQNNIYMNGVFAAPINFGSATPLSPKGIQDVFLAKYNQNGFVQFYKDIGNAGSFINNYGIVVSPDNNIYLSGYFTGTIDFDLSAAVANVKDHGREDMFLVKYDVNSNYKWAFGLGNNSCNNNMARSVAVDGNNDVLLTGSFCSTVNFNESGCASTSSAQSIVRDLFIAKYTAATAVYDNAIWQPQPNAPVCTATTSDPSLIKGSVPVGPGPFTYQWQASFDNITFSDVNENGPDYDPPLVTKTAYFRRIVAGGSCTAGTASNVITIAITPVPINTISTPAAVTSFCGPGDPAIISGSPLPGIGYTIQWQQSTDNITFTDIAGVNTINYDPPPITVTTYYRRIITAAGCAALPLSNVVTINIHRAITINNNSIAQPVPATFCSASADPSVINGSTPTGGTGNFTYQWQMSTDNITFTDISGAAALSINYDPSVITTTTYYRRGVLSFCSAPLYSNVVTITVTPAVGNNTLTAPTATSFCGPAFGGDITGTSAGGAGFSYQWQQSTDNVNFTDIAGANRLTYNTGLVSTTTYYRRLVTGGSCGTPSPSNVVAITISTGALAKVSAGSTICAGNSVTLTASGGTKYTWTPAAGLSATNVAAPTATPLVTTTYKVIVSTGNCSDSAKVIIIVIPKPIVDAGEDKIILKGDKIQLAGKVTGNNVQYSWSPTTYLDDPAILTPTATPTEDITYTLTATTDQNCAIETDKVTIKVYEKIVVPNTFTPNGDGTNDTWNIAAMTAYTGSVVTVYNREGLAIFKSTGYTKSWDGTFKGKLLPFGTYYYVIDLKNGTKPLSGWLTIVK